LHSTVNDLLTFLSATMGHVESPLAPAFRSMLATQRKGPAFQQALGWWVFTNAETQIITHVGGTLGFASQIAYDPKRQIGVVVLSNSVNPITDITTQLLTE
jgi:serine-type D-Ala-D-Ala carboxypeptidase/endopeptidase